MKIVVTAIAMVIAAPAAAQTAPSAQQHQGHAQHQQHQQQGGSGHSGHQMPQGQQSGQHGGQHGQHQGHAMPSDCCADRNGNGRMDCCENMAAGAGCCCMGRAGAPAQQQPAQPQSHQNH